MIQVGSKINDYEVVARLRSGGMAALYLGRRVGAAGFSRPVAIKVIHPHLSEDKNFVTMFVDEAKLSARISHPNVVHVEELGQRGSFYYLVMEYVHGCSLSQLIRALRARGRRFTPEMAASIAIQMADGLHAAHETTGDDGELLGVVHRDVSPQNILLSYRGHIKLIDFGVAKARGRSQHTTVASLKGKLRYMAPEQASSQPVDRRTDVYALGIVLWEMLTMRTLFKAENDLKLHDLVKSPVIEPPSKYAPEMSPALEAVVLKALSPDPANRPNSGQELRRMLVGACPEALAIDAEQFADLLRTVMADTIRDQHRRLPESVAGQLRHELGDVLDDAGGESTADAEVLNTLTTSASSLLNTDGGVIESRGSQSVSMVNREPLYEGAPLADETGERGAGPPQGASWVRWVAIAAVIAMVGVVLYVIGGGGGAKSAPQDHNNVAATDQHVVTKPTVAQPREASSVVQPEQETATPGATTEDGDHGTEEEVKAEPKVRPKGTRSAAKPRTETPAAAPNDDMELIPNTPSASDKDLLVRKPEGN